MIGLIIRSVVGGMLVTILGIGIAEVTLSWRLPWQLAVYLLPFSLAMACVLVYQYHLIRIRGALITYLEQAGRQERLPMCLKCGYNLEGSTGSRCPECGYRIAPRPKAETASEL